MCKESNVVKMFEKRRAGESEKTKIKKDSQNDSTISATVKDNKFDVLDEKSLEKVKMKFDEVWKRNLENLARLEKTRTNGNSSVLRKYKIK